MFPICDSAGRVVAFSGRIVVDDGKSAKYINSPETTLYNKSKILYGYSLAKGGIKKFNFSILVEGQMDVALSSQAGYPNTVGVSGTALTEDQLTLLNRLSKNVVMAFDADRAGVQSAGKGAERALSMGMDVKVARLPEGQDPADIVQKDPALWKKAIRESVHIVEFYLSQLRESVKDERTFKLRVQEIVLPFIARIKNAIDRSHFVRLVAGTLSVPDEVIEEEIRKVALTKESPVQVHEKGRGLSHADGIVSEPNDSVAERIAHIILWQKSLAEPLINITETVSRFEEIFGKDRAGEFLEMPLEREREEIFKTELLYEDDSSLVEDIATLLQTLAYRTVKQKFQETMHALRIAEREGNTDEVARLLGQSKEIADTLKTYIGKV
jgi:DNA primase